MNAKQVGVISNNHIIAELSDNVNEYTLLDPIGDNARYDLVVDIGDKFLKIQSKTGRVRNGRVNFNSCSTCPFTNKRKHYKGVVDLFAVYCKEFRSVYLVSPWLCGEAMGTLYTKDSARIKDKRMLLSNCKLFENTDITKFLVEKI